jgi:lipopolysaccharide/colanic/teichoic acid biosynthesis glycosyltransferase
LKLENPDDCIYDKCGDSLNMKLKRIVDLCAAIVLMIIASPVLLLVAAILFWQHRESPFYFQKRGLVLEKDVFVIVKFKTMFNGSYIPQDSEEVFSKRNSLVSIDRFCMWLRKSGLDELPQLLNIIKGDMSFVGPRPLSVEDLIVIKETASGFYSKRAGLNSRPGITGYWQIFGDRQEGIKNLLELELLYEDKKSPIYDLYLLWKTIPIVFTANHSDAYLGNVKELMKTRDISFVRDNSYFPFINESN